MKEEEIIFNLPDKAAGSGIKIAIRIDNNNITDIIGYFESQ